MKIMPAWAGPGAVQMHIILRLSCIFHVIVSVVHSRYCPSTDLSPSVLPPRSRTSIAAAAWRRTATHAATHSAGSFGVMLYSNAHSSLARESGFHCSSCHSLFQLFCGKWCVVGSDLLGEARHIRPCNTTIVLCEFKRLTWRGRNSGGFI
jgi:hypothetical protein